MNFTQWLEAKKSIPCGQCFQFANNLVREMLDDGIIPESQISVCHGTVIEPFARDPNRHIHAWVETRGRAHDWQLRIAGKASLPLKDFYELFQPEDVVRYTPEQVMINQLKYKHHGPWHEF